MHGSFSPVDVHNTLIAYGPLFLSGVTVINPSGNVDVAPTVAYLLGTSLSQADGRVLYESLIPSLNSGNVAASVVAANVPNTTSSISGVRFLSPLDISGATVDTALTQGNYNVNLVVKNLTPAGKTYTYFDYAKVVRQ